MQTIGAHSAREEYYREKERKKWRKRIKKENRRTELGMQTERNQRTKMLDKLTLTSLIKKYSALIEPEISLLPLTECEGS